MILELHRAKLKSILQERHGRHQEQKRCNKDNISSGLRLCKMQKKYTRTNETTKQMVMCPRPSCFIANSPRSKVKTTILSRKFHLIAANFENEFHKKIVCISQLQELLYNVYWFTIPIQCIRTMDKTNFQMDKSYVHQK